MGLKIMVNPNSIILHQVGMSSDRQPMYIYNSIRNRIRFSKYLYGEITGILWGVLVTMDQLRSAWKTSVQPRYVTQTLGQLANPNSSIYNDKKQVQDTWKRTVQTMHRSKDIMQYKLENGVAADIPSNLKSNL